MNNQLVVYGYSHIDIMNMWVWQRSLIFYAVAEEKARQQNNTENNNNNG